ncbi:MAG: hypothetical protein M1818_003667 [Claussenomyces sp. TS43310]|nr:MAG: hypothetical protein M1818_003667 [Claussenomyces sp. TS43310]
MSLRKRVHHQSGYSAVLRLITAHGVRNDLFGIITSLGRAVRFEAQSICTPPPAYENEVSDTYTIGSQANIDALSSCQIINGSLSLELSVLNETVHLNLDGVKNITGSLFIQGNNYYPGDAYQFTLSAFSMASLNEIGGSFQIHGDINTTTLSLPALNFVGMNFDVEYFPSLTTLNMTSLAYVGGYLTLDTLLGLTEVDFNSLAKLSALYLNALPLLHTFPQGNGVKNLTFSYARANYPFVINGTGLTSLDGLSFFNLSSITIGNNPNLRNITLDISMLDCTYGCEIFNNANGTAFLALPSVQFLNVGSKTDLKGLEALSIPRLQNLTGTLDFDSSNNLTTFYAPALVSAGELVFFENAYLSNISLPALRTIDMFSSEKTPAETLTDGISMPSLVSATSFRVGSSSHCALWKNDVCLGVIGELTCAGDIEDVEVSRNAKTCADQYPADGSWPKAKKIAVGVGIGVGLGVGLPLLCTWLWWRWRAEKVDNMRLREERAERVRLEREGALDGSSITMDQVEVQALPKYQQHESSDETEMPPGYHPGASGEEDHTIVDYGLQVH